jgi:hypothetical protein
MPAPMRTALADRRLRPGSSGLLIVVRAMPLASIPGIIDKTVPTGSYVIPQGSENASMPTKCIDQMPPPMLIAPALAHA